MTATNRLRRGSRRKFTPVDRRVINRSDLSFRALGLLVWLLDKPDGWTGFSAEKLSAGGGREGRDAVRAGLRQLEELGYLVRDRVQTSAGLWVTETWVYEHPDERDDGPSPTTENQASVNQPQATSPTPGKPTVGKPGANHFSTERESNGQNGDRAHKGRSPSASEPGRRTVEQDDVELHHATDEERERVRAGPLAAARAGLGLPPKGETP